jgi:hypothetical protein
MTFVRLLLFCVIFVLISAKQQDDVQCQLTQPCTICDGDFPSPTICRETGYYQMLNCTLTEGSQTIIEGCTPDIKCESAMSLVTFFLFQLIVVAMMLVSGFCFLKRKKDLNDAKVARYTKLVEK